MSLLGQSNSNKENGITQCTDSMTLISKLAANTWKEDIEKKYSTQGGKQIIKAVPNLEKKTDNSNLTIPQFIYIDHHSFQ